MYSYRGKKGRVVISNNKSKWGVVVYRKEGDTNLKECLCCRRSVWCCSYKLTLNLNKFKPVWEESDNCRTSYANH